MANAGPSTATSIQVTDTPSNLTITNVGGGGCSALPCTIASLAAGANVTVTVTATITTAGSFDNSATATAVEPDPNTTNNTDSTGNGGSTLAAADVSVIKTVSGGTGVVGQALDYTILVENHGPATATGVVVTDALPASFALISATPAQGSCSGTPTVACNLGTMANGATATIVLHGTVIAAGSLSNTATVTRNETDPVASNDSSTAAPAPALDIPTLDGAGLSLLMLALALAAALLLRSRA